MQEMILILDFGSQVTQLIGRRLRELNVYCEIHPFNKIPAIGENVKGVILSGSPFSVRDEKAPIADLSNIKGKLPLLGICYGAQFISQRFGGEVATVVPHVLHHRAGDDDLVGVGLLVGQESAAVVSQYQHILPGGTLLGRPSDEIG